MRAHPFTVAGLFLFLLIGVPAIGHAQPARSFRELAASGLLNAGDRIEVKSSTAGETTGVFAGFTNDDEIVLFVGRTRIEARFGERDAQRIRRSGGHAAAWGAAIGAASALAVTAWAASSYGENEGGRFCSGCLIQWGALSVPAGAGIGLGIGFAIDKVRHSTVFTPLPGRRSVVALPVVSRGRAGLLVSARF